MNLREKTNLYDAYYYAHNCGCPYKRDDHWLSFFNRIAAHIVRGIQPSTVLDAGCAMGFLVEKLRQREIEAWGVDISEYAIHNVHSTIQPFCWIGSVVDPFPKHFDLIVCIEVLEHLQRPDAERAVANFCQYSDDVLFSSTPIDYAEGTHFNVQQPEYWAELFAREGFFRDVDFDASFITPWAVRFRRKHESLPRMVREYERKFWLLWKENSDLRKSSLEIEQQLARGEQLLTDKDRVLQEYLDTLHEKEQNIQELRVKVVELGNAGHELRNQLTEVGREYTKILNSRSWRFMQRIHHIRYSLIPLGSHRERWMHLIFRAFGVLRSHGPAVLFQRTYWKIRTNEPMAVMLSNVFNDYQAWISENDPSDDELAKQKEIATTLSYKPTISIITPVFNPPPQVLREMFESVLAQTYDNWELCVVDGASDSKGIKKILREFTKRDSRISVKYLNKNLGISGNSNEALDMAEGEFIAILDHDDLLAPNMLFEVVQLLNEKPDTDLIYFDEDKISEDSTTRHTPFFKPDWSPELLISANYLTHSVIRRSLVENVGYFDPAMDGTQDWDLVFRCAEKTNRIEHIPKILYHWRQISGSAATQLDAKSWVFDRQVQCVQNHLQRLGIQDAQVSFTSPGYLRVAWPLTGGKVSIIIPTKDKLEYLKKCVNSILSLTTYPNYEIVLVDNDSTDSNTLAYYQELSHNDRVRIIENSGKFNYSAANNLGARYATGDYLLFLNNDMEILEAEWLEEMVRWADRPEIGVVGAKLLYPDGTIQHAGVVMGMEGHASHVFWGAVEKQGGPFGSVDWYRNYMAVTGACMMMRREVFDEVRGFNENYVLVFSDIEICVRIIEKGYRVLYNPYVRLRHYEGKSRGNHIPAHDIQVGFEQLLELVEKGDPYFNPNLSYASRMPSITGPNEESRGERLRRLRDISNND